jgi:hypothetical protein
MKRILLMTLMVLAALNVHGAWTNTPGGGGSTGSWVNPPAPGYTNVGMISPSDTNHWQYAWLNSTNMFRGSGTTGAVTSAAGDSALFLRGDGRWTNVVMAGALTAGSNVSALVNDVNYTNQTVTNGLASLTYVDNHTGLTSTAHGGVVLQSVGVLTAGSNVSAMVNDANYTNQTVTNGLASLTYVDGHTGLTSTAHGGVVLQSTTGALGVAYAANAGAATDATYWKASGSGNQYQAPASSASEGWVVARSSAPDAGDVRSMIMTNWIDNARFATNAGLLDGLDSTAFMPTGSYLTVESDPDFKTWTNSAYIQLGNEADNSEYGFAIGLQAKGTNYGMAIGASAYAQGPNNISIGNVAIIPDGYGTTIQIGQGTATNDGWVHFGGNAVINQTGDAFNALNLGGVAAANFITNGGSAYLNGIGITNLPANSGFPKDEAKISTSLVFSNATRTLHINANGLVRYTTTNLYWWSHSTNQTTTIADAEGLHYIYYRAPDGILTNTQTAWTILGGEAQVAQVYWDAVNNECLYLGDERHNNDITDTEHVEAHVVDGAEWYSGGILIHNALATGAPSTSGSNTVVAIQPCTIWDDDHTSTSTGMGNQAYIAYTNDGAIFKIMYATGSIATVAWRTNGQTLFPFMLNDAATLPTYNQLSGGIWQTNAVPEDNYFISWIVQVPAYGGSGIYLIPDSAVSTSLTGAQARTYANILESRTVNITSEMKPLYRLIFLKNQTAPSAYSALVKYTKLVEVQDLRLGNQNPAIGLSGATADLSVFLRHDGTVPMTGNLNGGGQSSTNWAIVQAASVTGTSINANTITAATAVVNGNTIVKGGTLAVSNEVAVAQLKLAYNDTYYSLFGWHGGIDIYGGNNWNVSEAGVPRITVATTTGNLGVGTNVPSAKLHVAGNAKIDNKAVVGVSEALAAPANSGTTQAGSFRINSTSSAGIEMGIYNTSPYAAWIQGQNFADMSLTQPLALNPIGGNVGIGSTAPSAKLHISDTTANPSVLKLVGSNGDANPLNMYYDRLSQSVADDDEIHRSYMRGSNDVAELTEYILERSIIIDTTDGTEDSSLETYTYANGGQTLTTTLRSGNLGVGTASPAAKLHVAGDVKSDGTFSGNGAGITNVPETVLPCLITGRSGFILDTGGYGATLANTYADGDGYVNASFLVAHAGNYKPMITFETSDANTSKTQAGIVYINCITNGTAQAWNIASGTAFDLPIPNGANVVTQILYSTAFNVPNNNMQVGFVWRQTDNAGGASGSILVHSVGLVRQ